MANAKTTQRFAQTLLDARLIDPMQLKAAMAHAAQWGMRLPRALAELGFADEDAVVDALAKSLRVPARHLGNVLRDNGALRALGPEFCERHAVFPITMTDRMLTLAMADPTELDVIDQAGSRAGARVTVVMASEAEIQAAIAKHFRGQETPQRRKSSNVRPAGDAAEEKLSRPLAAASASEAATLDLSRDERQRLEAVAQNQEKLSRILRTLQELLAEKGYLRR